MASLTGQTVSSTYDGLLKTTDNDVLNAGAKEITDGLGNGTGMTLSTTGNVGISGNLTVDGAFKDSSGNGGTIGQVLVSTSIGTNWVDSLEVNAVDSIIAGDGISVDTATGNVTITNTITNNNQLTNGAGYVDGSGTANYVPKWTDGDTIGNSVIYDDGTNVGIGTISPTVRLDVLGDAKISNSLSVTGNVNAGDYSVADWKAIDWTGSILQVGGIEASTWTTTTLHSSGAERMRITSGGDISFRDSSANEAFYWDASTARLGLGTTSPLHKLELQSASDSSDISLKRSQNVLLGGEVLGSIFFSSMMETLMEQHFLMK